MGKKKFNSIAEAYWEMKKQKISEEEFQEILEGMNEILKKYPYPEKIAGLKEIVSVSTKMPKQKKKKD